MSDDLKREEVLQSYKNELIELLHKDHVHFDRQLVYLSAGAIALTVAYYQNIEKLTGALINGKYLIFTAWILLTFTLVSNMLSHLIASHLRRKTIREINSNLYNKHVAKRRNSTIVIHNYLNLIPFLTGIILIVIFIILNS